jgi:hypothetical protein
MTGTLRKNVTQVQKTGKISVEQSFFAGCPCIGIAAKRHSGTASTIDHIHHHVCQQNKSMHHAMPVARPGTDKKSTGRNEITSHVP